MFDLIIDNRSWLFEGFGTLVFVSFIRYLFIKKNLTPTINKPQNPVDANEADYSKHIENTLNYKNQIGKRIKWLREEILKLTLREMAEFYEFNSVSELENYESGFSELPLNSLKKFESFFFINPKFIELGQQPIFDSIHLRQENVSRMLENGFSPLIACCPYDRRHLYSYILFQREERGFIQIRKADLLCSFASKGGGRLNIQHLINVMIDRKMNPYDLSIFEATNEEWLTLGNGNFYDKYPFNRIGSIDQECTYVFNSWYEESKASHNEWEKLLSSVRIFVNNNN
jgi:hypothetical protein